MSAGRVSVPASSTSSSPPGVFASVFEPHSTMQTSVIAATSDRFCEGLRSSIRSKRNFRAVLTTVTTRPCAREGKIPVGSPDWLDGKMRQESSARLHAISVVGDDLDLRDDFLDEDQ